MATIDGINISLEEVSATANKISQVNIQLTETLGEVSTAINNLESTWQSEAGTTIRSKINGMRPIFENYKDVIDSYVQFLNQTVQAYTETENAINANANAFQ